MTSAVLAATLLTVPASARAPRIDPADLVLRRAAATHAPLFDVREDATTADATVGTSSAASLAADLGAQGVVDLDERTGAPRVITRLDGFLTGPSDASPEEVALGFVRSHRDVFGISSADLAELRLVREYVDILGTHHLVWVQVVDGIPLWDADLRAHVTAAGELVSITGSPVAELDVPTTTPTLPAKGAISAAYADAGASAPALGTPKRAGAGPQLRTEYASGDDARVVLFHTGRETRLAWRTTTFVDGDEIYVTIVDDASGEVLWRTNLVRSDGTGLAWEDDPRGPQQQVTFPVADGSALRGPNAWVYPDTDDDDRPDGQVPALTALDWAYPVTLDTTDAANACSVDFPCTWDASTPFSWEANLEQNATQVYFFLNRFHDHLLAAPIGFTAAAGNFEGADAVVAHVLDGANTGNGGGLPDANHRYNANMATLPDGEAPLMQMYLFPAIPGAGIPSTNGGDDASVVYHEYVHGLSNRLVTFADGTGALNGAQSGAMGEAWSDFYAMDFLVSEGSETDGPSPDVILAEYISGGRPDVLRTEPIDCTVGSTDPTCPGGARTGRGGYTYGDFGSVYGVPEVHGDGEIWAQTLWDLRRQLGSETTLTLVTRAMELSPVEPSFLDMRNAILEADRIAFAGANAAAIWGVFAARGMGFFAVAIDGSDTDPVEDFSTPPVCPGDCGTVSGRVVDRETGAPVEDVRVAIAGHASGFLGDLAATTTARGRFSIPDVPFHDYQLAIASPAHETLTKRIDVDGDESVRLRLRRNWAALAGGADLVGATRPDYSAFGCGPERAFDGSLAAGWGSDSVGNDDSGVARPRSAVVRLASKVDITTFGFATGGTCGDGPSAAVKAFSIYTRTQGGRWVLAYERESLLKRHVMHTLRPTGGKRNVRMVRIVMRSNAGDPSFMDMLELSVRGTPSR
ncbi:MAG TPA: M36 family metallopeptidase [Actinomycetota bacterium]|nr:M36 family metallopeptidase [Actinomycetota bacterium]